MRPRRLSASPICDLSTGCPIPPAEELGPGRLPVLLGAERWIEIGEVYAGVRPAPSDLQAIVVIEAVGGHRLGVEV